MAQPNRKLTDTVISKFVVAAGWQENMTAQSSAREEISDNKFLRALTNVNSSISGLVCEDDITVVHTFSKPLLEVEDKIIYFFEPEYKNVTETMPEAITSNWEQLANSGFSNQTYAFLVKLAGKKTGWRGAGSRALDAVSLTKFLNFWDKVSENAIEPEFALLPNGNIQAEWYKDERHFIELEFTSNDMIFLGIFDGDSVIEGVEDSDKLAASEKIVTLLSLKEFGPLKWSYEG